MSRAIVDAGRRAKRFEVVRGKVEFAAAPVRPADSLAVRRLAAFALSICERLSPGQDKVMSRHLWLGSGRRGHWGIGRRLGVGSKELARYAAILEEAGILRSWQPPAEQIRARAPELVGKRSGRAYRCWHLPTVPRELAERLRAYWGRKTGAPPRPVPLDEPVVMALSPAAARFMALAPP